MLLSQVAIVYLGHLLIQILYFLLLLRQVHLMQLLYTLKVHGLHQLFLDVFHIHGLLLQVLHLLIDAAKLIVQDLLHLIPIMGVYALVVPYQLTLDGDPHPIFLDNVPCSLGPLSLLSLTDLQLLLSKLKLPLFFLQLCLLLFFLFEHLLHFDKL